MDSRVKNSTIEFKAEQGNIQSLFKKKKKRQKPKNPKWNKSMLNTKIKLAR